MIEIIQNNPFRILGVYANAAKKDILANQGKMKAFLKVGRGVSFPTDFVSLLSSVSRNETTVADADSKLTLPKERIKYAQFWFIKMTSIDDIAFNHLSNGDIDTAIDIWSKKANLSSLQNRLVVYFIKGDYRSALSMAYQLYEPMEAAMPRGLFMVNSLANEFAKSILGDNEASGQGLDETFLKSAAEAIGAPKLLQLLPEGQMKNEVAAFSIKPILAEIQTAISAAEQSKGKGCTERYNAGVKLMNDTKPLIEQLKQIVPQSDTQYQMIADKLGSTILQCGIDFYNASEAADAAQKTMRLQKYAQSVVVGKMAKDRCKENVDILNEIIKNLPPQEVFADDKAIKEELRKYCQLPDKIVHAVTLLNNTKPILQRIRAKLGANNSYYLKISTQVVGNALHNIIEEINQAQKYFNSIIESMKTSGIDPRLLNSINTEYSPARIIDDKIKPVMREAWKAIRIMDGFDMESDFKTKRYIPNRSTLKGLCDQVGVSASSYLSSPSSSTRSSSSYSSSSTHTTSTSSSSSSDDTNWGCIVVTIIIAIITLISIAN